MSRRDERPITACSGIKTKDLFIYLFIMNQQSERLRQNIYVSVGVVKDEFHKERLQTKDCF
jgi:hypothetical protein